MSKTGEPLTPSHRFSILARDGFACVYCGARSPEARLHVDHVVPRVDGGTNDGDNLVTACDRCNLGKATTHIPVFWAQQRGYATGAFLCEMAIEKFGADITAEHVYKLLQLAHSFRPVNCGWVIRLAEDADAVVSSVRQVVRTDEEEGIE